MYIYFYIYSTYIYIYTYCSIHIYNYLYIYIYTAPPLPNFIPGHPPGAWKFHGAQPLGQHPRASYGPSPMTLRFTAALLRAVRAAIERAKRQWEHVNVC